MPLVIFLIDRTEVHNKIFERIVGQVFEIYAIELLGSLPTDEA